MHCLMMLFYSNNINNLHISYSGRNTLRNELKHFFMRGYKRAIRFLRRTHCVNAEFISNGAWTVIY